MLDDDTRRSPSSAEPKRLGARSNLEPYIFKTQLKTDRNWTDGLIRDFLGEPDGLRYNWHHLSGPLQKLYLKSRVIAVEATEEFQRAIANLKKRRAASRVSSRRIAKKRREKIVQSVRDTDFCVPKLERQTLVNEACYHYNYRSSGEYIASPSSDLEFLDRICVNYLRHECTAYDGILSATSGAVGCYEAKLEARLTVLQQIANAYPDLALECDRQMDEGIARHFPEAQ